MTNPSKIEILEAHNAMSKEDRFKARLERGDLNRSDPGHTLQNQLGHRLRAVFLTPETREANFESLLKQISTILP